MGEIHESGMRNFPKKIPSNEEFKSHIGELKQVEVCTEQSPERWSLGSRKSLKGFI